jgi:hypothetical protein
VGIVDVDVRFVQIANANGIVFASEKKLMRMKMKIVRKIEREWASAKSGWQMVKGRGMDY